MTTLAPRLAAYRRTLSSSDPTGVADTGVPGVYFFWMDAPTPRSPLLYDTGIVILAQGRKEGFLGARTFHYDADTCLVLGVPLPFECASYGSPEEPILGLRVNVDTGLLHRLVARFGGKLGLAPATNVSLHAGVEPLQMEGPLLDAVARLVDSLADPMDRQIVGPAAGTGDELVGYRQCGRIYILC